MLNQERDFGRNITFYAGDYACQFQAVTSLKNTHTVNVTLTEKKNSKFFLLDSKLTIQLSVPEMIDLVKVFLRWHKDSHKFSAGYHGDNSSKALYVNSVLDSGGNVTKYNIQLHDKANANINKIVMFLPITARFEIIQILLERVSLNGNATISDTLNILKLMDRQY